MPRHEEQRVLPFSAEFIFDIVADVGSYPEFLPWCVGARVYKKRGADFYSDVVIGFGAIRETWTSHVILERPNRVVSEYVKGPMKELYCEWNFTPHAEGALVDFLLIFEFKNPIFEKLAGHSFEVAAHKMLQAFSARAQTLSRGRRK